MNSAWVQGINLSLALIAVAMPFVVYLRTRQRGEHLGTWLSRRENQLLTTLGITLRNARWLTPTLFLRSLLAVARVSYGLFWLAALTMLVGEPFDLSWSWQRLSSPLPVLALVVKALLLFTLLGYWRLFEYGAPASRTFVNGRRLGQHWLMLLGYCALIIWGLGALRPISTTPTPEQLLYASEAELDHWIETDNLPPGFSWSSQPRPAPPSVIAALKARFQGAALAPDVVRLPGGSFDMGCANPFEPSARAEIPPQLADSLVATIGCNSNEQPRQRVQVAPFAISRHETSYDQWDACVADGGCDHWPDDLGFGRGDLPVVDVSWDDVQQYIAWLSRKTGEPWRLPTEAEWEYAARAGTTSAFADGQCLPLTSGNINGDPVPFTDCPEQMGPLRPLPVGSLSPNPWGLYDMHGNVSEWVDGCRTPDHHSTQCPTPADKKRRGHRGGSWQTGAEEARSAHRRFARHDARIATLGFRLVIVDPRNSTE